MIGQAVSTFQPVQGVVVLVGIAHSTSGLPGCVQSVATWNLTEVGPGDGGFVCVPGSHKSNFLQHMPRDVARFERGEDWVVQPSMAAGDVLIFTEALIHGTAAWTADHERRTLLYKYSPPHSTWARRPYDPADFPEATDRQRRLMAPPSVEAHPRVMDG
ncbi:MAG: phytanoyl-CoA dioxygenase family protein [Pseudomonadales bacterium]|nr:phytanoyl-CoA dioxygenase family protein [Pseudomonadales bacterium]